MRLVHAFTAPPDYLIPVFIDARKENENPASSVRKPGFSKV